MPNARASGASTIVTEQLRLTTRGDDDILDLTSEIRALVQKHALSEGQVLIFVSGSTAGITTVEYEPGLIEDLPAAFERVAPRGARYAHHERWHDGNGHSHVRASLLGPSLTVPVSEGRLLLGTWQQVVLVDFDNRPRERHLVVQLQGTRGQVRRLPALRLVQI
jgi:secondary thiamine-phosphate synthase enzyme